LKWKTAVGELSTSYQVDNDFSLPVDNVVFVAGFFFAFFGLMFSGAFHPILYKGEYDVGTFIWHTLFIFLIVLFLSLA
jgi:hypothetical protein